MFTKDDVGRKVISNEGHWNNTIGVIKEWDNYSTKYPVLVDFCNGLCNVLAGFGADGKCCVENLGSIRLVEEAVIDIKTESSELGKGNTMQRDLYNKITQVSPEQLAEAFWNMDSGQQARFYNHLDAVADFRFPFHLQSITDEDGLTLAGRRVMSLIGEYSHWGLVPKLKYNGSIK